MLSKITRLTSKKNKSKIICLTAYSKIKFVKKYIDLKIYIRKGVKKFKSDVLKNKYPNKRYSY